MRRDRQPQTADRGVRAGQRQLTFLTDTKALEAYNARQRRAAAVLSSLASMTTELPDRSGADRKKETKWRLGGEVPPILQRPTAKKQPALKDPAKTALALGASADRPRDGRAARHAAAAGAPSSDASPDRGSLLLPPARLERPVTGSAALSPAGRVERAAVCGAV